MKVTLPFLYLDLAISGCDTWTTTTKLKRKVSPRMREKMETTWLMKWFLLSQEYSLSLSSCHVKYNFFFIEAYLSCNFLLAVQRMWKYSLFFKAKCRCHFLDETVSPTDVSVFFLLCTSLHVVKSLPCTYHRLPWREPCLLESLSHWRSVSLKAMTAS